MTEPPRVTFTRAAVDDRPGWLAVYDVHVEAARVGAVYKYGAVHNATRRRVRRVAAWGIAGGMSGFSTRSEAARWLLHERCATKGGDRAV